MTQTQRVLAALERRGHISPVDFQLPNVIDGGAPVLRVAARIAELKAQGHRIETGRMSNGCAVYRLLASDALFDPDALAVAA